MNEINFWNLVGGVSGTLSALAFFALTIHSESSKKSLSKFITTAKTQYLYVTISQDLLLLIHPFMMAIIILAGDIALIALIEAIVFALIVTITSYKFYYYTKLNLPYTSYIKEIAIFFLIVASMCLLIADQVYHINTLKPWCQGLGIVLILLGLICVIDSLSFTGQHGLIIEITGQIRDHWEKKLANTNTEVTKLQFIISKIDFYFMANQSGKKKKEDKYLKDYQYMKGKHNEIESEFSKIKLEKMSPYMTYKQIELKFEKINEVKNSAELLRDFLNAKWGTKK